MEKLRAVIVDDEIDAVQSVKLIVEEYCEDVSIVGTANSALEGIKVIQSLKPDLVFLDVEMPHGTDFDLLEGIPERNFDVIFITAYNHYAVKAFKVSAIDYIMKPVDIDDLIDAVAKISVKKKLESKEDRFEILLENLRTDLGGKIAISTQDSIEYINHSEIIRIESEGSYSNIYLDKKGRLMVSKNLKELQDMLEGKSFYRTHKSNIVNLAFVKRFHVKDGGYIEMENGDEVAVSRRNKDGFLEAIGNYCK